MRYRDRRDGGRQLADRLADQGLERTVVLALPRGGMPVAFEVAVALGAELDVLVARKIGAPSQPELGIGAIAEGGEPIFDDGLLRRLGLTPDALEEAVQRERDELQRRVRRYRGDRPLPSLEGRDVVVVDDGLATGVTARAALRALREHSPGRLLLAAPVCAPDSAARLEDEADAVVCLQTPRSFMAVGQWYDVFDQTQDEEVVDLLERARAEVGSER